MTPEPRGNMGDDEAKAKAATKISAIQKGKSARKIMQDQEAAAALPLPSTSSSFQLARPVRLAPAAHTCSMEESLSLIHI